MVLKGEVRDVVVALAALGSLPTEAAALTEVTKLERWEELVGLVLEPLSDREATILAATFPSDDSDAFGAAWTLIHLLESAPSWPTAGALDRVPEYWREVLLIRIHNSGSPSVAPQDW